METRMKTHMIGVLATVMLVLAGATAQAQTQGFTTTTVNMRAGPSTGYPVVATLPPDATIEVYGCQAGYDWCDISWNSARGWIASSYILTEQDGKKAVMTPAVAAAIGISIVVFSEVYWNNHYKHYPWYPYWSRYYHPPVPGPYCYHAPQDPACRHYHPYPPPHDGSGGHAHHHNHQGGGHSHHHHH